MQNRLAAMHTILLDKRIIKQGTCPANNAFAALLKDHGSLENLYHNSTSLFEDQQELDELEQKIQAHTDPFQVTTILDPTYPSSLKDISGAPPVLYLQGDPSIINTPTIGVVGTRNIPSPEVTQQAVSLLDKLKPHRRTIVSGLALGCDTLAHTYAIEHDLKTIAVLGTPLNRYYPRENSELQQTIAKNHLVVSQYPFYARTFPSYFAHRNLVTASLSQGLLVIYANDKSGTMHAVKFTSQQQKPIYALSCNLDQGFRWIKEYNPVIK